MTYIGYIVSVTEAVKMYWLHRCHYSTEIGKKL
jgi:hypothetical protein